MDTIVYEQQNHNPNTHIMTSAKEEIFWMGQGRAEQILVLGLRSDFDFQKIIGQDESTLQMFFSCLNLWWQSQDKWKTV